MKYYYNPEHSECCYNKQYWKDYLELHDKESIKLIECKRDFGHGLMWCSEDQCQIESGSGECGTFCKWYEPCNGKNGRCRHLYNSFVETGNVIILTR